MVEVPLLVIESKILHCAAEIGRILLDSDLTERSKEKISVMSRYSLMGFQNEWQGVAIPRLHLPKRVSSRRPTSSHARRLHSQKCFFSMIDFFSQKHIEHWNRLRTEQSLRNSFGAHVTRLWWERNHNGLLMFGESSGDHWWVFPSDSCDQ